MKVINVEQQTYNKNPMSRVEHILRNGTSIGGGSGNEDINPPEEVDDTAIATEQDIDNMFNNSSSGDHNYENADLKLPDGYAQATTGDIDNLFK